MPLPLAEYALLSNLRCACLVGRNGSIDWLCAPAFDSPACLAALLGDESHGHWQIAPDGNFRSARAYREATLVLDTTFETDEGRAVLTDCMPLEDRADLIRVVECLSGTVTFRLRYDPRCDYGALRPHWSASDGEIVTLCGADAHVLRSDVSLEGRGAPLDFTFTLSAGQRRGFAFTWFPSYDAMPGPTRIHGAAEHCARWWRTWSGRCRYDGPWRDAVLRSLITLKALTYEPTGGMIGAPTTSLPAVSGGDANFDERYCWLRHAALALETWLHCGYRDEAWALRDWLLRAAAGHTDDLPPVYAATGNPRIPEWEAPWLPGYGGSRPVRIGNAAAEHRQLDLHGQLIDTMHVGRQLGMGLHDEIFEIQRAMLGPLAEGWRQPNAGHWDLRAEPEHFTHSKVMAWMAFDRSVKDAREYGFRAPLDQWGRIRDEIHRDVCANAVCETRGCFVQSYGANALDASTLLLPLVGFLPPDDPRVRATTRAVEEQLSDGHGLVWRFGSEPGETSQGADMACSFWLVENQHLDGQEELAQERFEHLLSLRNDVGLMPGQFDPSQGAFLANFPQMPTHLTLIDTARQLGRRRNRLRAA